MSQVLNAVDLVNRVRQRVHDLGSRVFDDAEILATADDHLRGIFAAMRASGQAWFQDSIDVPLGTFATSEQGVYEYELPSYVADVQKIEAVFSGTSAPTPIPRVDLELSDSMRGNALIRGAAWMMARHGYAGSIQIRGSWFGTVPTVRIWFIRALGPMVYGQSVSGTTTGINFGTVTGAHRARADLYTNMSLEITSDSGGASNVGQVRRISSSLASGVILTPALPVAASATTVWAMVVPVPPEHTELLVQQVAVSLLARTGNPDEFQLQQQHLARLERTFQVNIGNRQTGEPKRVYNSRMRR